MAETSIDKLLQFSVVIFHARFRRPLNNEYARYFAGRPQIYKLFPSAGFNKKSLITDFRLFYSSEPTNLGRLKNISENKLLS